MTAYSARLVFCIVESPIDFDPPEQDDGPLWNGLEAIRYKDVVAVMGVIRGALREGSGLDRGPIRRSLGENVDFSHNNTDLLAHQLVNEELMKRFHTLPLKFGLILDGDCGVREFLRATYPQLKESIHRLKGKVEYVVEVSWDIKEALREILREGSELHLIKEEMGGKTMEKPLKLEEVAAGHLRRTLLTKGNTTASYINTRLSACAVDRVSNGTNGEDVLINSSYLIEKFKEDAFDGMLTQLGKKYQGKLEFRSAGPLPAYSFTNMEVSVVDHYQIDEARKLLGLGPSATRAEIKQAFTALAIQNHPNRDGSSGYWVKRFKAIWEAYSLLMDYCDSYRYSFRKEDVGKSIFIRQNGRPARDEVVLSVKGGNMN